MKKLKFKLIISVLFISIIFSSCQSTKTEADRFLPDKSSIETADFMDVDGIDIHYSDTGEGAPELLFLHGFLGNIYNWDKIIPVLQRNYRTVAYDRLGFGFTGRPETSGEDSPYTARKAEERAVKLIELLDMSRPVLVGHSAGGNLALRLALQNPEKYSALILISPAIYNNGPPGIARFFIQSGLFNKAGLNTIRRLPDQLDELLELSYFDPSIVTEDKISSYTAPLSYENWDTALWEYTKAQGKNTVPQRLDELKLPVLIIHGRDDQIVPVKESIKASGEIKSSVLVVLNECGHIAFEEKPEETLAIMKSFLNGLY